MTIDAPAAPFTLKARADRIDRMPDGTLAIFDYKTGRAPTDKQAKQGFAPQLPLEAAIAKAGGFEGIEPASLSALGVIRFHPRGFERAFFEDPNGLALEAREKLEKLIARYDDENTAYKARVKPMFESEPGEYDHLSRLKEWSAEGAGGR
jgi:ATP-dependent helicase/nuclease subunit B